MRFLYSTLFYCLMPFILLRMQIRARRAPAYRQRLLERFGIFKGADQFQVNPAIWVHAVSVGETIAAVPVIEALLENYPQHRLIVTTTTPTGSERVQALFGDRVFHVYAPWDLPGAVQRFLRRIKPELLLLMETELWPNMLHYAKRADCQIVLANARLSARSARGYGRVRRLSNAMMRQLDSVACQSREDGDRFLALGLRPEKLTITGSIKFDLELSPDLRKQAHQLRASWRAGERSIVVAASTHPGEDEQILDAFKQVRRSIDDCVLVLVPRHPERFDAVYSLCVAQGWRVQRRSSGHSPGPGDDVIVGDTMGELLLLMSVATIAVIGGSLVEHGGHNVLEAAAWGVPVVTGPHMFNFGEISALLTDAGAMIKLSQATDLGSCLSRLLADSSRRQLMGDAGQRVVTNNRGARARLLTQIATRIKPGC
ncbi:MAG: 3-deoxy-D-manno-octulosonic acid transferase [Halieaceae bacterium]|jgi:3-deoxy-D-manno-octulosonic-acid transferase|nr:3-deoxy-D-manno-octulosonic acid transferase [Halieaceae bacterium]